LKFKAIECYHSLYSSVAKADNNFCYFRGESECDSFLTPNKTDIKSINGTFAKCPKIKITPKLQKLIHLSITVDSYATEAQILLKKLLKIFNNPKNFDLKFNTEDKHIYVHKCILKTNCKYFEKKFAENTRAIKESTENKNGNNEILITEYSYDVYYSSLKYLYSNSIDIETNEVIDLLVLANDYREEDLKLKCIDIIKNIITIENVCSLYYISYRKNIKELEDHCFDFAFDNLKEVKKSGTIDQMDEKSEKEFKFKVFHKLLFIESLAFLGDFLFGVSFEKKDLQIFQIAK
jgi:hypothetical protein